ncbi:MAG TPA: hypothetical protein VGH44_01590 [Candidatus Saccharimonadia bacterium]|jgi:hypothetical protein
MMLKRLWQPLRDQGDSGYVLLLVLVTCITLFITLSGILSLSLVSLASAKRTFFDTQALYVAETGVDNAVFQLNATNGTYTGTGTAACPMTDSSGAVQTFSDSVKGKGTYQICVKAGSIQHELIVYVAGKVYRTPSDTNPISTHKLKVTVEGSPAGSYAVQTGPGGLVMNNSSNISQGPVYIGGYLTLNNSSSIGTASTPISVSVANARCGSGGGIGGAGTYPTVCNTGVDPNPITMSGAQAHIYGNVSSNDQTNFYATKITNPGVQSTSGVIAPTLPGYDRVSQVGAVASTITPSAATCTTNSGTVTWPANVKITGDVVISNKCTVIVSGNAWITGNFTMRNSAIIKVASGITTQPTIMVDGSTGVTTSQTASVATNSSQIGMEFITFYSTSSCTTGTTSATYCDSLSGSSLYNSQTVQTVSIGNQGAAPGSVFYAKYTQVTLGQAGTLGALLGQTINLSQSGNLVFTSTVVTGNYSYNVSNYQFATW